jgi:hypothetical protein
LQGKAPEGSLFYYEILRGGMTEKHMSIYEKSLPIKYPMISTYTQHAHLLSILEAYDKAESWIYSNYILFFSNRNYKRNSWCDFYFPMPYEIRPSDCCKWLITQKISWDTIKDKISITQFIINAIDSNQYVHLMINFYYIQKSRLYKKNEYVHDTLIFGYDRSQETFKCADFLFQTTNYEFADISFEDMEKAFLKVKYEKYCSYLNGLIFLYQFNEECDYEFDERNITNGLIQYYQNVVPEYWKLYNQKNGELIVYGMDIYEVLINYIKISKGEGFIDIRPFYLLYDHKKIMIQRMKFLENSGSDNEKHKYLELACNYDNLASIAYIITMMVAKYNIIHKDEILNEIVLQLKKLWKEEKEYLESFLG